MFEKYDECFLEKIAEEERVTLLDYSVNDTLVAFAGSYTNVKKVEQRVVIFDYHDMEKIVKNSSDEVKEDFEKLDEDFEYMLDNGKDYYGNLPDYDIRFAFKKEDDY